MKLFQLVFSYACLFLQLLINFSSMHQTMYIVDGSPSRDSTHTILRGHVLSGNNIDPCVVAMNTIRLRIYITGSSIIIHSGGHNTSNLCFSLY